MLQFKIILKLHLCN